MKRKLTFGEVDPTGNKQKAISAYYYTRSKSELVSLIMNLFYPEDIKNEYDELPGEFKIDLEKGE